MVVAVPPFALPMTPVSENVVLPFTTVEVTFPEPRTLQERPPHPLRDW